MGIPILSEPLWEPKSLFVGSHIYHKHERTIFVRAKLLLDLALDKTELASRLYLMLILSYLMLTK